MTIIERIELKLDGYLGKPLNWLNDKLDYLEEKYKAENPVWDPKDMQSLPAAKTYTVPFTGHLDTQIEEMRDRIDDFMEGPFGIFGAAGVVLFWATLGAILLNYIK